jgi:hypothetical protein
MHAHQTDTEPAMLRYFQARRVVRFNLDAFPAYRPAGPLPARITERVLFTPDVGVHLCEARTSIFVQVLGYDAEFDEDVSDELREWWDTELLDALTQDDDYYVYHHDLVASYAVDGPVEFTRWFRDLAPQGEYESGDDGEREALDDAFANHLV